MSDEPQPEYRWAPLPEKPKRRGRVWLIVGLSVAAVAIVGVLLFLFLPRPDEPAPTASPTASISPTASPTASATPTPTPSATAEEPADPAVTPPPVPDPDLDTFAAQVSPPLNDAQTGLSMVADSSGQDALLIVEQLQQDAERLASAAAPSSIADDWNDAVSQYAARLSELSDAYESGSGQQGALAAAEAALQEVRTLVGL